MGYVKELRELVGSRPLILPGAVVIIVNDVNEILLQLRGAGGWGLPGGIMELGESLEETAVREVFEETGLTVRTMTLAGVFSGKEYYLKVENGDELFSVTAVYISSEVSGELMGDGVETKDLRYFPLNQLPTDIIPSYLTFITSCMGEQ